MVGVTSVTQENFTKASLARSSIIYGSHQSKQSKIIILMLKIIRKSGLTHFFGDFPTIFNIFAKLIFALKFNIWVLTHPNNLHTNFYKVIITG